MSQSSDEDRRKRAKERSDAWYQQNKERVKQREHEFYLAHIDEMKERSRRKREKATAEGKVSKPKIPWVCDHCGQQFYVWPHQARDSSRRYCSTSCTHAAQRLPIDPTEAAKQRKTAWYLAHKDETRLRSIAYRAAHAEEIRAKKTAWATANKERVYAAGKRARLHLRDEMFATYGVKCACCGETERTFLTLDHVNGGGNEHRKRLNTKSSYRILGELRRAGWPQDGQYRILCWNCQFGVQQPDGCPHQRRNDVQLST